MPDLYDAVARGMWTYSHAAFPRSRSGRGASLEPGTLIALRTGARPMSRSSGPSLYFAMGGRRNTGDRMHFAARDDMFLPGFFAGFPTACRRLSGGFSTGRRRPLASACQGLPDPERADSAAREVLAAHADRPLDDLLPEEDAAAFAGARRRRASPDAGRRCLRGEYADLLWPRGRARRPRRPRRVLEREAAQAARRLPHPRRALAAKATSSSSSRRVARRSTARSGRSAPASARSSAAGGRAGSVPLGIGYDPLVRAAPASLAHVPPVPPPKDDVEGALLALMRLRAAHRGQFVASCSRTAPRPRSRLLERELAEAVLSALRGGPRSSPSC